MRTLGFVLGGLALLAVAYFIARSLPNGGPLGATGTIVAFVVVWLVVAAGNLYVGVTSAGYSVREEFPIFLLIFLVPAVAAALVKWRLL